MMLPPATSQFGAYLDHGATQSKPKKPADASGADRLATAEKISAASIAASAAKAEAAEKASAAKRAVIADNLAAEKAKSAAKAAAADAQAVAKIQVIEKAAAAKRADYAASLAAEKERIALRDEQKLAASADRVARAEIAAAQKGADGAARIRAGAREAAIASNAAAARGTAAQRGVLGSVIRKPEFNFMGRMEGLLGGFTLGGLLMWTRGAQAAAAETRNLAAAARLPMEEFLRLQQAAKDSGTPVEQLNAAIKDYAEGRITLEQVGESVGLIGYKAGMASDEIKRLAASTRELAEMDKQFKILQEGASNFGKSAVVGLGRFFQQVSRMGIESVAQRRVVSWWEAGEMMRGERAQEVRAEGRKAEKALSETRAKIRVEADLTDFFGDVEREAERQKKIKVKIAAADEGLRERIERITVAGPRAGDSLARIGGYMGGRMDNRGIMLAERTLKVAEEQAQHQKELVKIMGGDA
jgi:hypothetical protein